MSAVREAREWLESERPTSEEIQVSIENTCHLLAQPCSVERRDELRAVIDLLVSAIPGFEPEISLPETPCIAVLDTGPLCGEQSDAVAPLSPDEKRKIFDSLRSGQRPF